MSTGDEGGGSFTCSSPGDGILSTGLVGDGSGGASDVENMAAELRGMGISPHPLFFLKNLCLCVCLLYRLVVYLSFSLSLSLSFSLFDSLWLSLANLDQGSPDCV